MKHLSMTIILMVLHNIHMHKQKGINILKYIEINNTVRSAQTQSTKTFVILCASSKVLLSLCTSQSYYICLLLDFGMLDLVSSIGPCTLEIFITEHLLMTLLYNPMAHTFLSSIFLSSSFLK